MIIEHVYIRSFGKLINLDATLGNGINIINGSNEAGKSTFCNFIKFILYGVYGTKEDKYKYISWKTSKASGYIEIKTEDGNYYKIDRDVTLLTSKDNTYKTNSTCSITDLRKNAQVFKDEVPGEVLLGVPLDIFESTIFIKQLVDSKIGGKDLATSAENILFSADEEVNVNVAIAQLEKVRVDLLYKNGKGGKIYDLENEISSYETRLKNAENENADLIETRNKIKDYQDKLKRSQLDYDNTQNEINKFNEYKLRCLMVERKDVYFAAKDLENQKSYAEQCEKNNKVKIYSDEFINQLESAKNQLEQDKKEKDKTEEIRNTCTNKIYNINEKVVLIEKAGKTPEKIKKLTETIDFYHNKTKKLRALYISLMILGLVVLGFSVFSMFVLKSLPDIANYIFFGFGAAFLAASIIVLSLFLKANKTFKHMLGKFEIDNYELFKEVKLMLENDAPHILLLTEQKNTADDNYKIALDKYNSDIEDVNKILQKCNFEIKEDVFQSLDLAIAQSNSLKETINYLSSNIQTEKRHIEMIDRQLLGYSDEYLKKVASSEFDEEEMKNFDIENTQKRFAFLGKSISNFNDLLSNNQRKLGELEARCEDPSEIAEVLDIKRKQLESYKLKYDAITLARDTISLASGKLRDGLSPKLAESASKYIKVLSSGKYDKLGINNNFEITYEDDNSTHSVTALSAGAGDITYLALRLALIENLYTKYAPPFIFDEGFSRLDEDRLENVLRLLAEITKGGLQCFIFTCHSREENILKTFTPYLVHNIQ